MDILCNILIGLLTGIVSGVISGVISGVLVTKHYRKKDIEKEKERYFLTEKNRLRSICEVLEKMKEDKDVSQEEQCNYFRELKDVKRRTVKMDSEFELSNEELKNKKDISILDNNLGEAINKFDQSVHIMKMADKMQGEEIKEEAKKKVHDIHKLYEEACYFLPIVEDIIAKMDV